MSNTESPAKVQHISKVPETVPEEVTEDDLKIFFKVVSVELDAVQREQILVPPQTYPHQESLLAVHWHPEHVPMDLIARRIDTMFPNRRNALIIPTQHNELLSFGDYSGVEVDCYSGGFNQKVQLLLHFRKDQVEGGAHVLKQMLAHTFKYRSSQLFDFMHTITSPVADRIELAARGTGASEALVQFVTTYVKKIEGLVAEHYCDISPLSIKNKLLRNFFDCLRPEYGDPLIDRAQTFLTAVKKIVKEHFPLHYFFRTAEIIEEARHLNAGIVIPHPEQFWPVLLAEYDVDGVEVWNPQSHRYTEFLISVINHQNRKNGGSDRPLLIFMGDDTHMGEKTRDPREQRPEKAGREIGYQPVWDDMEIRKSLIKSGIRRRRVITEYKARLGGV